MKNLILSGCFICAANSAFAASNLEHCTVAQATGKLEGTTIEQCLCAYGQADLHLSPELKGAMMESHIEGSNPMTKMIKLGRMADIKPKMEAYGKAVQTTCKLQEPT